MNRLQTYPLTLNAQVELKRNQIVEPVTTQLQNPSGDPFLIDEIRLRSATSNPSNDNAPIDIHASIGMSLHLGRVPLTNNFVPLGNFGAVPLASNVQGQERSKQNLIWKLWKPLLIRPGEFLTPRFHWNTSFGVIAGDETPSILLNVSYAGRRIIDPNFQYPEKIVAPWVSAFQLAPYSLSTASGLVTESSNETNLVNMFDEPLFVQRFIGRWAQSAAPGSASILTTTDPNDFITNRNLIATAFTTVRAVDSFGNILVRDPTPWTQVFRYTDRCWNVQTTMPPKSFYIFTVERDFTQIVTYSPAQYQYGTVSMVGYREINA